MAICICDDHKRGFRNYLGFMGHWRFTHPETEMPTEDQVTVDELPEGYAMAESAAKRTREEPENLAGQADPGDDGGEEENGEGSPAPRPARAPKPPRKKLTRPLASGTLPEGILERTRVSLEVHQFPETLTTYILNLLKLHPEAQDGPANFSNFLNWACSTSPEGKRHAMRVPMVTMEVFPQTMGESPAPPYYPAPGGGGPGAFPYYPGQPWGYAPPGYGPPGYAPPGWTPPDGRQSHLEESLRETKDQIARLTDTVTALVSGRDEPQPERTMTIHDEQGRPMTVPYDPEMAAALRHEVEMRVRVAERKEMFEMIAALNPRPQENAGEALKAALAPLEAQMKAAQDEVVRLRTEMQEERLASAQKAAEEAKSEAMQARHEAQQAKEMAASASRGDKTVVDYMQEAGIEMKTAMQEAGQGLQSTVKDMGRGLTNIATRTPPAPETRLDGNVKPQEIADLMQVEDRILEKIGGRGSV